MRTRKFGTVVFCAIFSDADDRGRQIPLKELGGWIIRHDDCLSAEGVNHVTDLSAVDMIIQSIMSWPCPISLAGNVTVLVGALRKYSAKEMAHKELIEVTRTAYELGVISHAIMYDIAALK